MPQTSVNLYQGAAVAGMSHGSPPVVLSRVLETAAGCNFGRALAVGATAGKTSKVLAADADSNTIEGVVLYQSMKAASTPDVAQYGDVTLVREGLVWLLCPVAIAPSDYSTLSWITTGANAGLLTNVVNASARAKGVTCLIGAGIGALGLFSLNLGGS